MRSSSFRRAPSSFCDEPLTHPRRVACGVSRLVVLLVFVALCSCESSMSDWHTTRLDGATMGTYYRVSIVTNGALAPAASVQLKAEINAELQRLNRILSHYDPTSDLSVFNASAIGEWSAQPNELVEVVSRANQISLASHGAFDVTVGPLVRLWGFGTDGRVTRQPAVAALAEVMDRVGYKHVEIRTEPPELRRTAAVELNLSAIAKGYAVDQLCALLLRAGFEHFLVDIGGELRARGHSGRGTPWQIGIERPDGRSVGEVLQRLQLTDVAVATSGDYRNYFEVDGVRYSHTIDPATGAPVTRAPASVTVLAADATTADGWATAMLVLGLDDGLALAEQLHLAVLFVTRAQGQELQYHASSAMPALEPVYEPR